MKHFSLSCYRPTFEYEKLIIRCFRRMSNLERLNLSFSIVDERLFDGHHVKNEILIRLPRLTRLTFDIRLIVQIRIASICLSKEKTMTTMNSIEAELKQIQKTFDDLQYPQVRSYIDYFLDRMECQCHLYTSPCQMSFYQCVSNKFPGGYYPHVRLVSLYDEHPFEHQFFLQLVQSFPLIEKLVLSNRNSQKGSNHDSNKSMRDDCHLPIVEYCHLIELDIEDGVYDYIEQFLCHSRTSFRQNIRLHVNTHGLSYVTKRFTREDTRINCAKVEHLSPWGDWRFSKCFQQYFPLIKVEQEENYYCSDFRYQ